jgi:hypothetical protein
MFFKTKDGLDLKLILEIDLFFDILWDFNDELDRIDSFLICLLLEDVPDLFVQLYLL